MAHLTIEEREAIQKGIWEQKSVRQIASELSRPHSTVLREIRRNNPVQPKRYSPRLADERAREKRQSRGRLERLKTPELRAYVVRGLKSGLSPEQISGRAKLEGVGDVSHEAIYQYVYAQVHRNGYGYVKPGKEDLRLYLARRHKKRAKMGGRKGRCIFKPRGPSIETRPKIVSGRTRLGDWEGDSIESKAHGPGLNSLVDRKSGLLLLSKLEGGSSAATRAVVSRRLAGLPAKTLTVDNGKENRYWQEIEADTGAKVYFAHPYSSWERGTNENTNGLVRRYFPKGTDFSQISDEEVALVEYALNTRPRKRLGYRTPLEVWGGAFQG